MATLVAAKAQGFLEDPLRVFYNSRPAVTRSIKGIVGQLSEAMVEGSLFVLMAYDCLQGIKETPSAEIMHAFEAWEDEMLNQCMKNKRQLLRLMSDFRFNVGSTKSGETLFNALDKSTDHIRQSMHSQKIVGDANRLRSFFLDVARILDPREKERERSSESTFEKKKSLLAFDRPIPEGGLQHQVTSGGTGEHATQNEQPKHEGFQHLKPAPFLLQENRNTINEASQQQTKPTCIPSLNLSSVQDSAQSKSSKVLVKNKENEGDGKKRHMVRNYAASKKSENCSNDGSNKSKERSLVTSSKKDTWKSIEKKKNEDHIKDIQICEFRPDSILDASTSIHGVSAANEKIETMDSTLYKLGFSDKKSKSYFEVSLTAEISTPPILPSGTSQTKEQSACSQSKGFASNQWVSNPGYNADTTAVFMCAPDGTLSLENGDHTKMLRNFMTFSNPQPYPPLDYTTTTKKPELEYETFCLHNYMSKTSVLNSNTNTMQAGKSVFNYMTSSSQQMYSTGSVVNASSNPAYYGVDNRQEETANFCFGGHERHLHNLQQVIIEREDSKTSAKTFGGAGSLSPANHTQSRGNTPVRVESQASQAQPKTPVRPSGHNQENDISQLMNQNMTFEVNRFLANKKAEKLHVNLGKLF